jgi:hypothetical protein
VNALAEQVRGVAALRVAVARNRAAVAELRVEFQNTHHGIFDALREAEGMLLEAETQLKGAAEAHYLATGDKHPAPGVAIRERDTFSYTEADALAWAKQTGMALVPETFDRKALERIAKATPLPFVVTIVEPQVTLATDLDAALALAERVATPTEAVPHATPEPF